MLNSWIPTAVNIVLTPLEYICFVPLRADPSKTMIKKRVNALCKNYPELKSPVSTAYAVFETNPEELSIETLVKKYRQLSFLYHPWGRCNSGRPGLLGKTTRSNMIDYYFCILLSELDGKTTENSSHLPWWYSDAPSGFELLLCLEGHGSALTEVPSLDELKTRIAQDNSLESPPSSVANMTLESCQDDKAVALRRGMHDTAMELVQAELIQHFQIAQETPCYYLSTERTKKIVKDYLLCPLDEDGNTLLHYAVYFDCYDVFEFVVMLARDSGSRIDVILRRNVQNKRPLKFVRTVLGNNSLVPIQIAYLTIKALDGRSDRKPLRLLKKTLRRVCVIGLYAGAAVLSYRIGTDLFGQTRLMSIISFALSKYYAHTGENNAEMFVVSLACQHVVCFLLFYGLPWQVGLVAAPVSVALVMLAGTFLWIPNVIERWTLELPWLVTLYWMIALCIQLAFSSTLMETKGEHDAVVVD